MAVWIGQQGHVLFGTLQGDSSLTAGAVPVQASQGASNAAEHGRRKAGGTSSDIDSRMDGLFDALSARDIGTVQCHLIDVMQRMESLSPLEVMAVLRSTYTLRDQLKGWSKAVDQSAGYFERRGLDAKRELMGLRA